MRNTTINKYRVKGQAIEFNLSDGYSVYCNYIFNKTENKYWLTIYLKRDDLDYMERIDSLWLDGDRTTIKDNLLNFINEKYKENYFDKYIERMLYTLDCFDRGNEMFENERLHNKE